MTRELATSLVTGLRDAGVQRIFGMPGGGPNLDMIGCAEQQGIEFVLAHGETAACVMASTHGRLTGTPGVALVTRGPGLASAVNGLAQATLDRSPLLLVSDTVTTQQAPRVAHQHIDQVAIAAPVSKWSGTLGHHDPRRVAHAAAELALAGPAGAVHLRFDPTTHGDAAPDIPVPVASRPDVVAEARRACGAAERPVVLLGLDAAKHAEAVRAALEGLDCPVLTTYEGKGTVPESWSTCAGLFTGGLVERPLLAQADLVLGIGLDPVEPMPTPWSYDVPVVLLHSHDVPTGYFGDPRLVVGRYEDVLDEVLADCRPTWPPGVGEETRRRDVEALTSPVEGLDPLGVVRAARQLREDAVVTVDSGAHMLAVMPLWLTDEPDSVLISNGLATMGFALPAAIGAALARPGRRVVAFTGDGGLGMALAELETLARLRLDVSVVVLNDAALTLIRLKQKQAQGDRRAVGYAATDFAATAEAMGVPGDTVHDAAGLRKALGEADPGPHLVDARIDPSGYAHVLRVTRG